MVSLSPAPGSGRAPEDLDARWESLVARALDPGDVTGPLGDVIRLFGELGLAGHLEDPANAHDQCISVSTTFERMCAHRGIPAETVDGFCFTRFPPFKREAMVAGHTAVRALASCAQQDVSREIAIDWTARQFDPVAPVPLIVEFEDWRAFWQDAASAETARAAPEKTRSARRQRR